MYRLRLWFEDINGIVKIKTFRPKAFAAINRPWLMCTVKFILSTIFRNGIVINDKNNY